MNLTILNLTAEQTLSIQEQLAGGGGNVPPPSGDYDFSAIKSAPSNWAAYTFCSNDEWGQLTNKYGAQAVNDVKNYYVGTYRMPGLVNPGDPATSLRKTGEKGPCRYYYITVPDQKQVEDTGQADQIQEKLAGKKGPTLPVRP
jgi:hypothetical protein